MPPTYPHPTKRPPPQGDALWQIAYSQWPGSAHCDNCGWQGWLEDLVDGKYCPDNAQAGHPATARPGGA